MSYYSSSGGSAAVVGAQFCAPHVVELVITKKPISSTDGDFNVTDVDGNLVFKVKGKALSLKGRRVLLDAAGNTLISMEPKFWSWHERWKVFRGNSSKAKDLLFSVKRSSIFQCKAKLHVFLASNKEEKVCDFKVKSNYSLNSCKFYQGDSSKIIGKMNEKTSIKNQFLGKDTYKVVLNPNVDYALMVALVIILNEINKIPDVQPND